MHQCISWAEGGCHDIPLKTDCCATTCQILRSSEFLIVNVLLLLVYSYSLAYNDKIILQALETRVCTDFQL